MKTSIILSCILSLGEQQKNNPTTTISLSGRKLIAGTSSMFSLSPQRQLSLYVHNDCSLSLSKTLSLHSVSFRRLTRPPQATIFDATITRRTTSVFSTHQHRPLKLSSWRSDTWTMQRTVSRLPLKKDGLELGLHSAQPQFNRVGLWPNLVGLALDLVRLFLNIFFLKIKNM